MQKKPQPPARPTAERYFDFLGTAYVADDGTSKQPARERTIAVLRSVHAEHRPGVDLSACLAGTAPSFTGKVWFWSDLHFSHANIIKYCNRPFADTDEMNSCLVRNCMAKVSAEDILVFGGDITFGNREAVNAILRAIPAYKIHVVGNHDMDRKGLIKLAMDETAACLDFVFEGKKIFVSHYPLAERLLDPGQLNVHGHIHNTGLCAALGNGDRHANMSVETIAYQPRLLPELLAS